MLRYLIWSLRLRRVEYRLAEVPIFLIPAFLTIGDVSAFAAAPFWEGALIFFFLFAFGDLLNCLADRDLDTLYKPHLTEAVLGLGVRGVVWQAVLSALAATAPGGAPRLVARSLDSAARLSRRTVHGLRLLG